MKSCTSINAPLRLLLVLALVILGLMTSLPGASARVDYNCVFGEMTSTTTPEGEMLEYCQTKMDPPLMNKGDFIWATKGGNCYECVCEPDFGLACCECPRPRRRG